MSQPAAGTATTSTITVSTSDGLSVTVTSDGPITITPPVTPPPVTPPPGASTTIMFDDFPGAAGSLPNSAYWNVLNTTSGPQNPEAFGGGDQEQYLANPALVALDGNSNLVFTVGQAGSNGATAGYWPSGRVDSLHAPGQFYNGVFATHGNPPKVAVLPGQSCEFSAKTNPLAGLWPSLWFMCPGAPGGGYPSDYYEFDLMESGLNGIPGNTESTAWGPGATAQQNLSNKVGTTPDPVQPRRRELSHLPARLLHRPPVRLHRREPPVHDHPGAGERRVRPAAGTQRPVRRAGMAVQPAERGAVHHHELRGQPNSHPPHPRRQLTAA